MSIIHTGSHPTLVQKHKVRNAKSIAGDLFLRSRQGKTKTIIRIDVIKTPPTKARLEAGIPNNSPTRSGTSVMSTSTVAFTGELKLTKKRRERVRRYNALRIRRAHLLTHFRTFLSIQTTPPAMKMKGIRLKSVIAPVAPVKDHPDVLVLCTSVTYMGMQITHMIPAMTTMTGAV